MYPLLDHFRMYLCYQYPAVAMSLNRMHVKILLCSGRSVEYSWAQMRTCVLKEEHDLGVWFRVSGAFPPEEFIEGIKAEA